MRKAQKRQAEEFAGLLMEAHSEIGRVVAEGKREAALVLLEQCQEGAMKLGELIEGTEGEDCETIPILEKYCEVVYQIYEELVQGLELNVDKIYKRLQRLQIQIENSIRNGIKARAEVVFLPYKASMWDSLESIWKAATKDPDCDAYVIPVPYYDKNPDGTFRQVHYEGKQYPKNVPVMWYKDYDFETRKPDVIFIHNPYDNCNFVTSVPPYFFSDNLKKLTDMLVYVPYFILDEVDPDNKKAVESMAHFCTVPGVMNADRVIVQSERMRQVYINVMTDCVGKETRWYWEQKILGLGSPKVDKVLNTQKEELEIPKEWMKIIQKPDGSWKKIIFYNTSVGALLQYNEEMLEKIKDVFCIFRKKKEEVTLLWRPHPLIKSTIESMRPELWEKYKKIQQEYCKEGWGIFDNSPDIDRAVRLSDAYYGNPSSVVQLFKAVKKPVMIQEISFIECNNYDLKEKS